MYKEKFLAYYQANPKKAVFYIAGLIVLLALLVSGTVLAVQGTKEATRLEAEKVAIQAQQAEDARLAAEEAKRIADEAEKAAEAKRIADAKAIADAKVAAEAAKAKTTLKTTGYCIKIPAHLQKYLSTSTPPDSGKLNGQRVCKNLADGKKDKPSTSGQNPKGHNGGCCLDWDEIPNANCCYPVGSVYEPILNNFFKNNTPELLEERDGKLKFKKP